MKYMVENPTSKKKAVRAAGGLVVIDINSKATVETEWSDVELARYEAAGLKIKQASGGQKKADDAKGDDK